jgi:serine phosphatase RsbU (regulator of sigma subunit)
MDEISLLPPVLYVDDEKDNLIVFKSTFRRNYNIYLASSGKEGLEIMRNNEIHLIITDQRMPEMTGIQFLEKVIPDYPDCVRMILTGFTDIEAIIEAINTGRVHRYITKPWNSEELKITIDNGLETFHLKHENRILMEDLKKMNKTLEQRVIERTRKIEEQNKEITDSIHYASRILNALLPPEEEISRLLPPHFIIDIPRDIVSGDFFWITSRDDKLFLAVADCTGHGVPGAFMSILGITYLNEIMSKSSTPMANEILSQLSGKVTKALHQTGKISETRDGMEIALCIFDLIENNLQFAGAFRPLYLIRDNELQELNGDTMPIGIYDDEANSFTNKDISLQKDDMIYLFSDGYVDQLGGEFRKTFRSLHFRKMLLGIHAKPLQEQKEWLKKALEDWKGEIDQVDDILVVGIRI